MNTVRHSAQASRFGFEAGKGPGSAAVDLGLWLGGLLSFLDPANPFLRSEERSPADRSKEMSILQSALLHCSKRAFELEGLSRLGGSESESPAGIGRLSLKLRDISISGEAFAAVRVDEAVWRARASSVLQDLAGIPAAAELISEAESASENDLPDKIKSLLGSGGSPPKWDADLKVVIPRIAKLLGYLSVVREMLVRDAPLKTSIVVFSKIDELMREMTTYINNRLRRFPDDTDALFGSLDAAAYTASIELRKVHSNELRGLVDIRPTPLVYARIETAYSLLNDSLQMTLVNFAQLVDRDLEPTEVFPNLLTKEQESLQLRENLWHLLQIVQKAEQDPESCPPEEMRRELADFRDRNLYYLFYKDMETVERFIEEVIITADKKDLVPILHRFGAYLETLLGQVNMRVVLANHPFEPLREQPHEMMV